MRQLIAPRTDRARLPRRPKPLRQSCQVNLSQVSIVSTARCLRVWLFKDEAEGRAKTKTRFPLAVPPALCLNRGTAEKRLGIRAHQFQVSACKRLGRAHHDHHHHQQLNQLARGYAPRVSRYRPCRFSSARCSLFEIAALAGESAEVRPYPVGYGRSFDNRRADAQTFPSGERPCEHAKTRFEASPAGR